MLNVSNIPADILRDESPKVGDIYRKAGGPPGFWWVISVCPNGDCYVLAFDRDGQITGAQRYGQSYLSRNDHRRVGYAALPTIDPEWLP